MKQNTERFTRIAQLLGDNSLRKLHQSYAVVIGLGATGSYAVEGLVRAGIGRLKLIDFDVIEISNINRQLYALESTLGRPKAEVAVERVRDINPECCVEGLRAFVTSENLSQVLYEPPDVIIDAIDSLNPKVDLLEYAVSHNIPVVSCMGAALRMDESMIKVAPLDKVRNCRLARQIRKRLRKRGIDLCFPCVYSSEERYNLPETAVGQLDEQNTGPGRKRRILGSMPTITGIFGLTAANVAIHILAGKR